MSPVSSDSKPLTTSSAEDSGRGQYADDENKQRGNWSGRLDFVLSLVGSVLEMSGNVFFSVPFTAIPIGSFPFPFQTPALFPFPFPSYCLFSFSLAANVRTIFPNLEVPSPNCGAQNCRTTVRPISIIFKI